MSTSEKTIKVGLDLGTSYSYVGVFKDGTLCRRALLSWEEDRGSLTYAKYSLLKKRFLFGRYVESAVQERQLDTKDLDYSKRELLESISEKIKQT